MSKKSENSQHDELSRGIGVSFAIHAFILSLFTLKAVFFTSPPINLTQAVRVDIVGLPEKLDPTKPLAPKGESAKKQAAAKPTPPAPKPEPKAPPAKPAPKAASTAKPELPKPVAKKQDDAINLERVKTQQQKALERLNAMAALERIKEEVASDNQEQAQRQAQAAAENAANTQSIKGNIVSPGTSLTGLNKLQHDTYASDLDQHVKQFWALPEWLARRDYKAKAIVFIDSKGNIIGRRIVSSSGNQSYDDEVLQTIDRSAPFPAPPEKFIAVVSVDGILIGFPE